ncbi:hypothetical protein BC567DRAFT_93988 [Phyllosticta citribraziliensis]
MSPRPTRLPPAVLAATDTMSRFHPSSTTTRPTIPVTQPSATTVPTALHPGASMPNIRQDNHKHHPRRSTASRPAPLDTPVAHTQASACNASPLSLISPY